MILWSIIFSQLPVWFHSLFMGEGRSRDSFSVTVKRCTQWVCILRTKVGAGSLPSLKVSVTYIESKKSSVLKAIYWLIDFYFILNASEIMFKIIILFIQSLKCKHVKTIILFSLMSFVLPKSKSSYRHKVRTKEEVNPTLFLCICFENIDPPIGRKLSQIVNNHKTV